MKRSLLFAAAAAVTAVLAPSGIAAETTELASSPDFWLANVGVAQKAPAITRIAGPDDKPALRFTATADGNYQGLSLIPTTPFTVEEGDSLHLQMRQSVDGGNPVTFTVVMMFVKGENLLLTTKPVGKDWTEIVLPMELNQWRQAKDNAAAQAFGAIRRISIFPGTQMDKTGETVDVADVYFSNAGGAKTALTLPDSLEPTETEKGYYKADNWAGEVGNRQTPSAPKITIIDTPQGKAAVATVTSDGQYQGISVVLPEPVNLKKYKALAFEVKQPFGPCGGYIFLYYTNQGGVRTSFPIAKGEWVPIRVNFNYDTMESCASFADPAPGKVNKIKITLFEKLQTTGQELGIRKLHFIPKDSDGEEEEE